MDFKDIVTGILALAAIVFFFYAIIKAYQYSNNGEPGNMPSFLRNAIVAIGGLLATNYGAVFGISVVQGDSPTNGLFHFSANLSTGFREIAAIIYLLALIIAFIFWARLKFKNDPNIVVDSLPLLSKTLLGIMVAMLALWLGASV